MSTGDSPVGGHPPNSSEAQAAIERVRAATTRPPALSPSPRLATRTIADERVRGIKRALAGGGATRQQIAEQFGVSRHLVGDISRGKTYREVRIDEEARADPGDLG